MTRIEHQNIDLLIARHLDGGLSESETREMEAWVAAHPEEYEFLRAVHSHEPDGSVFDIDNAWETVSEKIGLNRRVRLKKLYVWSAIAASLIIFALAVPVVKSNFFGKNRKTDIQFAQTITSDGETRSFRLPDGSLVKLQKNSKLSYEWGEKERRMQLEGSAFFDVAHNPERPFVVHTHEVDVKVLGTSFVVDTRFQDKSTLVVVKSGLVNVADRISHREMNLQKGQSALATGGALSPDPGYEVNAYAWATNELAFDNEPLDKVAAALQAHFKKSVRIEGHADKCRVTAVFKEEALENIMTELQAILNFKYKKSDGGYVIYDLKCP